MLDPAVPGLALVRVRTDAELEEMITVQAQASPERPPPRLENLRHNLDSAPELMYLVARLGDAPVGCGFVEPTPAAFARGHLVVVPEAQQRGVGSALLTEASRRARELGKHQLEGAITESDARARAFFERRGYEVVGGEQAVALDLTAVVPLPAEPPAGVRIVSRAERPDLLEGMYAVSVEAEQDIPDFAGERGFDEWRSTDVDRPSLPPELSFLALAGDEVVGFASLHDFGKDTHNSLTAVKRAWRRRGVATALKRTQIAAAKEHGFGRLVTTSETRNTPMRALNEKLGYAPEPSLSQVTMRGPLIC
jgi:GNAT superfamily N-acetyltransferase